MSQGDQFHQYGYDHYLKAPKRTGAYSRNSFNSTGGRGVVSSLLYLLGSSTLLRKLQSPVIAGGALAAAAALFIGVVVMTYSSGDDAADSTVPIIKADIGNVKYAPADPGGMDIPYRQSTIMARGDQPSAEVQSRAVENLLADKGSDDLISKEEAFNRATQSSMGDESGLSYADKAEAQDDLAALHAQAEGAIDVLSGHEVTAVASEPASVATAPAFELEKPAADDILQKIGSSKSDAVGSDENSDHSKAFVDKAAKAAVAGKPAAPAITSASLLAAPTSAVNETAETTAAAASKPDPSSLHNAGQSPETLEYVRSVLDKNSYDSGGVQIDGEPVKEVQNIEPALGSPADVELGTGEYFVQLASITDAKRAPEEWAKMQDKYAVLVSSRFRVQEASLPGGTFYRIQAGPMSKDGATQICDSLKQAGKPGGCLVVK